ncbi:metalloregulator ArsR/SmtB family transcription factor [Neolewinella lacunae]|uniref:Winged helix-turn-helix transcriptional regulator n=1 Tax=Neolewinella lacunae TaxID=1517758 RepID=A0A923TFB0_9BACT|nr:metalloregulator ArsR/SmtB family transcription factor [Neolewinella lacunae]MBC6996807.1 winged helix-turn-helix transcriptional regulator [Neolewinella lacunae]MDN3637035.1 metalloregulator ArsR/SmtB family transcription factor [Neolewinella lacunae]
MGLTKAENYTQAQNELAVIYKALGHPARIAIIQQLLEVNCCICGDFAKEIELAQPTISKHLQELKAIGIIQGTIEGTSVNYCINAPRWREIQALFNQLFNTYVLDRDCPC